MRKTKKMKRRNKMKERESRSQGKKTKIYETRRNKMKERETGDRCTARKGGKKQRQ